MPIVLKTCTQCKQAKPLEDFPPHKKSKDGKQTKCHVCRAANQRDYVKRNPDKKRESDKRFRETHSDYLRETKRAYSANNRERLNQQSAERAKNNKERRNAIVRSYRNRNLEAFQVKKARERARKANANGDCTTEEWKAILNRYAPDGICPACGKVRPLTLDHVVPMALGGTNNPDNLQPLCNQCNATKGQKTTDYRR